MYRFLFTGRWLGYLLLAAVFASICGGLGMWQLGRKAEVDAQTAKITSNYSAAPVAFSAARNDFQKLDPRHEWTPVTMHGTYDVAGQRVVRNRSFNSQPGYEVVVPLRLTSGDTVVIDRGWLPIGNNDPGRPDSVPEPVSGEVAVVARLRPAEPAVDRGAPAGQLASIDLTAYQVQLGYPILAGAYGQLVSESPAAPQNPAGFLPPVSDDGTHLSYSLQWFAFGVLFFVGYGYAARQQARSDAWAAEEAARGGEDTDEVLGRGSHFRPSAPPKPRRKGRRASAEEEEDALLDAQGF